MTMCRVSSISTSLHHLLSSRRFFSPRRPFVRLYSNCTPDILAKVGRNLHLLSNHPLELIKRRIKSFFVSSPLQECKFYDRIPPYVTPEENFDSLLVPLTHVSRQPSDTYWLNTKQLLRTHTSAHQVTFLSRAIPSFLVCGDCYRRDEIDATHYPVFHQMEGVRVWSKNDERVRSVDDIVVDLKNTLEGLITHLFGPVERRWLDDSFPFTHPSLQVEVKFNDKWMEILGCGVIRDEICATFGSAQAQHTTEQQNKQNSMQQRKVATVHGWAFGLGLERLAMILFGIPDIRLFWCEDARFLSQFQCEHADLEHVGKHWSPIQFVPFSKFPACYKDLSFWLENDPNLSAQQQQSNKSDDITVVKDKRSFYYHANDLSAIIREIAGDLVESVQLLDEFQHPQTKKTSVAYRINYRSMSKSLTNEQVNTLHQQVREEVAARLPIILRGP